MGFSIERVDGCYTIFRIHKTGHKERFGSLGKNELGWLATVCETAYRDKEPHSDSYNI